MTHRFRLFLASPLLLALAAACATSSQTAKKSTSPDEQSEIAVVTNTRNSVPPQPGDELICEFEETVGSHIPKRICRSKSELERLRDETQEALRNLRPVATSDPKAAVAPGH